jgi:hypothetical protein
MAFIKVDKSISKAISFGDALSTFFSSPKGSFMRHNKYSTTKLGNY